MKLKIDEVSFNLDSISSDYCREYVKEIVSNYPGMHPLKVLIPFLTSLGGMLGKNFYVENRGRFYPNLWTLILAPSGSGKSTGLRIGSKIALEKSKEVYLESQDVIHELKELERIRENKRTEIQNNKIERLRAKKSDLISCDPFMSDKVSTEGFIRSLQEGQSGYIHSTEANVWFTQFSKDFNKDLKYEVIKCYDCAEPIIYKLSSKTIRVEEPFAGFCGVSTFAAIKDFITPEEIQIGMLSRMLIFNFSENIPPTSYITLESIRDNPYEKEITKLINEFNESIVCFKFDEQSAYLFDLICKEIQNFDISSKNGSNYLDAFKPRWRESLLKISMLLAFLSKSRKISDKNVYDAYTIIVEAIKSTAEIIKNHVGLSDFQLECRDLLNWLEDKSEKEQAAITYAQILNSFIIGGKKSDYDRVIEMLCFQEKLVALKKTDQGYNFADPHEYAKARDYCDFHFISYKNIEKMIGFIDAVDTCRQKVSTADNPL